MAKKAPYVWVPKKRFDPEKFMHQLGLGIIRLSGGLLCVTVFLAAMIALSTYF